MRARSELPPRRHVRRPAQGPARRQRKHAMDDDAVTVVVATILLAGIMLATLVSIRLYYVPVWEQDAEAAHLREVGNQIVSINSDIDRLVSNRSLGAVSNAVSLGRDSSSIFSTSLPTGGELAFNGTDKGFSLASNQITFVTENGTNLAGLNETWVPVSGSSTIDSVAQVQSFRLRVDVIDDPGAKDHNDLSVELTDRSGIFAGNFTVSVVKDSPDFDIIITTHDASGGILISQGPAYHLSNPISPYWVDLMAPEWRFDKVLLAAATPIQVQLVEAGLTGNYAITYLQDTGSGSVLVGGTSGRVVTPYSATQPGGTMRFRSNNAFFLDQEYALENGAVILKQADGAVFKVRPGFTASLSGNQVGLDISLATLTGDSNSHGAEDTAVVYTTPLAHTDFLALAPRFTLNVTTEFPSLWSQAFSDRLAAAGLSSSLGQFTVASGSSWASVTVYGVITAPGSTTNDLTIKYHQAVVQVDL